MPSWDVFVAFDEEDVLAGRLYSQRRRGRESATFTYDSSYLERQDAYALDPQLPLTLGPLHTQEGVPLFRAFGDSSPDRWGQHLIRQAEEQQARARSATPATLGEIDFLVRVRDDLRQGNLRFREAGGEAFLAAGDAPVPPQTELVRLLAAAGRAEEELASFDELALLIQAGGSSLGGARPKAHVIDADGRIAIAKFPSARFDAWNVMAWEKVALDLAERAGITVPESQLIEIAGRRVLIIQRFDRRDGKRIGFASAMTMLEANDHDQKSYLEIAEVIEEQSPEATRDLHELWRRIAFTVLISNTDDHLRNHGFVRRSAGWALSPAYDLNPNPEPGAKRLQTAITEADPTPSIANLIEVAPYFRLDPEDAAATLGEVREATSHWRDLAETYSLGRDEIRRFENAFETAEAAAATAYS